MQKQTPKGWTEVVFTPETWATFKKRYREAKEKREREFTFEGNLYDTAYAGYMIEFYNPQFSARNE